MNRNRPQDRDRADERPAASVLPQGSLGAWLRTQREARGVSLREIADASKISLRYLEALERDRFDVLPAPVFTRGFLKEYARVVGLDADEVVNLYLLAADETPPELPPVEPRAVRAPGGPSPFGYGLVLTLAVVLFLGVAVALSWWAQRRGRESVPVESRPVVAEPVKPPPAAPEPAPRPPEAAASAVPPQAGAVTAPAGAAAPASAVAAAPEAVAPGAAAAPAAPLRVVLEFSEDCWVEFVVDGRRRTSELRTSGEVLNLEAEDSILLTLGNVPGVRVEVDGRPFPLPTGAARVVHDLRIDRESAARLAGGDATVP